MARAVLWLALTWKSRYNPVPVAGDTDFLAYIVRSKQVANATWREKYKQLREADPDRVQFVPSESLFEESRLDESAMPGWDGYADETSRNGKSLPATASPRRQNLVWLLSCLAVVGAVACVVVAYF